MLHRCDLDINYPEANGKYIFLKKVTEADEEMAIYIYIFDEVHGCRTASGFHDCLPTEYDDKITDELLLSYKGSGELGTSYYYAKNNEPRISYDDKGGYSIKGQPSTSSEYGKGSIEDVRGERYQTRLRDHLRSKHPQLDIMSTIDVKKYLHTNLTKVSPFSGEGDDMLFVIDTTLVVANEDECDQEHDITSQSNFEVELQLEANMMLLMSQITIKKLLALRPADNPITVLRNLNIISCYGVSFGILKPIVMKKLMMDFSSQRLRLEKKYESTRDIDKAPRLACATEYLIQKIMQSEVS